MDDDLDAATGLASLAFADPVSGKGRGARKAPAAAKKKKAPLTEEQRNARRAVESAKRKARRHEQEARTESATASALLMAADRESAAAHQTDLVREATRQAPPLKTAEPNPKSSPRNAERKRSKPPAPAPAAEASNGGGGPGLRGDRAAARPARRRRRGGGGQELLRQEGLRRDHRPEAEAGAGRRGGAGGGGSGRRVGRGRRRGEGGGARGGGHRRRRGQDEEVAEPEQRRHHRRAARPRREAARAQGAGGGVASGPVVPEEHPGGEVVAGGGRRVRQGEHGRRTLPAQGGPQHVQDLPGPLQGPREDVQLLHHRKLWNSRDERHEREQADGSAQRIRVRSDIRGQGRRLDARRGCPVGDVRGVMQAPSDNEGIRSYWPCTKGDGEMQEQELRRGCTKCYARIKIPITLLAHPCIIFSVSSQVCIS